MPGNITVLRLDVIAIVRKNTGLIPILRLDSIPTMRYNIGDYSNTAIGSYSNLWNNIVRYSVPRLDMNPISGIMLDIIPILGLDIIPITWNTTSLIPKQRLELSP